jgi:glycerol uptake facilitator-like aquaporin
MASSPALSWVVSESLGVVLLLLVLIPAISHLEARSFVTLALLTHFLGVISLDILSGATLSPNFCLGLFIMGKMTAAEALARLFAEAVVSAVCVCTLAATGALTIAAPALPAGTTLLTGSIIEAALTAVLFLVILFVITVIPSLDIRRPIIAVTVRGLIYAGGPYTGAVMNPMVALAMAWHSNQLSSPLVVVYCMGPLLGTLVAAGAWTTLQVTR